MGLLNKITTFFSGEKRTLTIDDVVKEMIQGQDGLLIDNQSALKFVPWAAAISIISQLAYLPLPIYVDTDEGRTKIKNDAFYLLNRDANEYMSAYALRAFIMFHALNSGNGYAICDRNPQTLQITGLYPLKPEYVLGADVEDFQGEKVLVYKVQIANEKKKFLSEDIFHIHGLSKDGIFGLNPVELFRDIIKAGRIADKQATATMETSGIPNGIITSQKHIKEEDARNFLRDWKEKYGGLSPENKIALINNQFTFTPLPQKASQKDNQYVETRQLTTLQVAVWFNIPPHMLGDLTKSSYASIEAQGIEFVKSLLPWAKRFETETRRKLFSYGEQLQDVYAEHNFDALLRGDIESRYRAYAIGINNSFLTPNEIRQRENIAKIEGGNEIRLPLNTTTPSQLDRQEGAVEHAKPENRVNVLPLLMDLASRIDRRVEKSKDRSSEKDYVSEAMKPIADALGFSKDQHFEISNRYIEGNRPLFDVVNDMVDFSGI